MSVRQNLALLLTVLCACPPSFAAPRPIAEKVLQIPAGSVVAVKLINHQKVRGKLGPATDTGFELQSVNAGTISTQTIQYSEVKSISQQKKSMSKASKITIITLACVGVVAIALVIAVKVSGPFIL